MLKEILVHQSPERAEPDAAFGLALALAEAEGARITLLAYSAESAAPLAWGGADLPLPEPPDAAALAASAEVAAARAGVPLEVAERRSFAYGIGETLADWAHVRDLSVLATSPRAGVGRRFLWRAAVFDTGRPALLVPEGAPGLLPRRAVVAWDASRAAVRAAHDALPLLRRTEQTTLLTVTDDKEMRRGQSAIEMTRHLARHGVAADFAEVRRGGRSIAQAIAESAAERGAGLLVMGAHAHSGLREIVLGSATGAAFTGSLTLPVLLSY
jgi:nucleotide-binding universal stress UspA family protein